MRLMMIQYTPFMRFASCTREAEVRSQTARQPFPSMSMRRHGEDMQQIHAPYIVSEKNNIGIPQGARPLGIFEFGRRGSFTVIGAA
jgi:hypothetical protein